MTRMPFDDFERQMKEHGFAELPVEMHELTIPVEEERWFRGLVRAAQELSEAAIELEMRPIEAQMVRTMRNGIEQFLREQIRKDREDDNSQSVQEG